MSADAGLYSTNRNPRTAFNEVLNYQAILSEKPAKGQTSRPLTDYVWNHAQGMLLTHRRRLSMWGLHSGACHPDVFRLTEWTAEALTFAGGGVPVENGAASPYYLLGGIPVLAPFATMTWGPSSTVSSRYVHRAANLVTDTTVTDSKANWPTNAMVGRNIYIQKSVSGWLGPFAVVSNTASVLTVTGPIDTGQTGTANRLYRLDPVKPTASNRTDAVWLDVCLEEIGSAETAAKPAFNALLNENLNGIDYETSRTWMPQQSIQIEQGSTDGSGWVAGGGALTLVDSVDGIYTWTDVSGLVHYCQKIYEARRYDNANVVLARLDDMRTFAGRQARLSVRSAVQAAFNKALMSAGADLTRDSDTQFTISSCTLEFEGEVFTVPAAVFTAPTDGSSDSAWDTDETYTVCIPPGSRNYQVFVTADVPSNSALFHEFTTDGTDLPASLSSETDEYVDQRIRAYQFIELFKPDMNGNLRNSIVMKANPGGSRAITIYDVANDYGRFQYDSTTKRATLSSVAAGATGSLRLYAENSDGTAQIDLGSVGGNIEISAPDGITIEASAVAAVGDDGPVYWLIKALFSTKVTAPGVWFTEDGQAYAPILPGSSTPNYIVPAAAGYVNGIYDTDIFQKSQDHVLILPSGNLSLYIDAGGSTLGKAVLTVPLGLPLGADLVSSGTKIRVYWSCFLTGSLDMTMVAKLAYRDSMSGDLVIATGSGISNATFNPVGTVGETTEEIDPGTFFDPNTHALTYVVFFITASNDGSGGAGNYIRLHGIDATVEIKGVGKHTAASPLDELAFPFPGLLVA